jgi:hypothetical protein
MWWELMETDLGDPDQVDDILVECRKKLEDERTRWRALVDDTQCSAGEWVQTADFEGAGQ